jgi:hypothetical protein
MVFIILHAITPFWNFQIGVQYANEWDTENYKDRWSGVIAFQCLTPYKFELDNALYVSEDGDVTFTCEARCLQLRSHASVCFICGQLDCHGLVNWHRCHVDEFILDKDLYEKTIICFCRYWGFDCDHHRDLLCFLLPQNGKSIKPLAKSSASRISVNISAIIYKREKSPQHIGAAGKSECLMHFVAFMLAGVLGWITSFVFVGILFNHVSFSSQISSFPIILFKVSAEVRSF